MQELNVGIVELHRYQEISDLWQNVLSNRYWYRDLHQGVWPIYNISRAWFEPRTYRGLAACALQYVQFVYNAMLVVRLCYSLAQHAYTYGVSTLRWLHLLTDIKKKLERLEALIHIMCLLTSGKTLAASQEIPFLKWNTQMCTIIWSTPQDMMDLLYEITKAWMPTSILLLGMCRTYSLPQQENLELWL